MLEYLAKNVKLGGWKSVAHNVWIASKILKKISYITLEFKRLKYFYMLYWKFENFGEKLNKNRLFNPWKGLFSKKILL